MISNVFRVPKDVPTRNKWIQSIKKHQSFQNTITVFNVCIQHFNEHDYSKVKEKCVLKPNALPSIFEITNIMFKSQMECLEQPNSSNSQNEVTHTFSDSYTDFNAKNEELKAEIRNLKINHQMQIEGLKKKIEGLENKLEKRVDELNLCKKELTKKNSEIERLKVLTKDLKTQRYISPKLAEAVNVYFYIFIFIPIQFKFTFLVYFTGK